MIKKDFVSSALGESKGVYFDIDYDNNLVCIGVNERGKMHKSYLKLHDEILSRVVQSLLS